MIDFYQNVDAVEFISCTNTNPMKRIREERKSEKKRDARLKFQYKDLIEVEVINAE